MARVYVGIGSNLRAESNLQLAVSELRRRFGAVTLSPVYRNPAVGFDGEDFLNMAAGFGSELSPSALVAEFEAIHSLAGRTRGPQRFVSRTLDIDLLLYDDLVADKPPLPRADILDYRFVLQPMADMAPGLVHPLTGRRLDEHLAACDESDNTLLAVPLDFGASGR